ncbi:TonB-dependent receptor [Agaricicola taiwanensis]|uniref:TonB-dependent receptor n=2 Tax=Agaricicola taiwanensis TaxID=591372 RepID=A0A8J2YDY7_9RHOB|nr:TonB-dependent receptor [Agaricicola taiwanensis]
MAFGCVSAFAQEVFPRTSPRAGFIVSAKGGEELQFPAEPSWRPAFVRQDIIGGDTLRTGEIGTLGLTFADQTTIRVGRLSTLVVNEVATSGGSTELTLPSGSVWARASRGGSGVTVKTPAASAAIRGTDWSLAVVGDRTSLVVLEGVVVFSNPQGSVTVHQGEGATARIGERPTKTVLVRPDDREQMMFYLELRGLFRSLPAGNLDGAARRAERSRLAAIPAETRTTEDWIAVAENGLGYDRRDVVVQAVAEARSRLGGRPNARLDLVEAMLAASAKRYEEAARLFSRAAAGTGGRQKVTARCGYYAASVLADPKRDLTLPKTGSADQDVCAAYVTAFGTGLEDAEKILRQSEQRSPDHLLSSLLSAQVSLLLNRRDEMRATVARMVATDPDSPETLLASGYLKLSIDSDIEGAVADFSRGVEIAPGDAELWNGLGLAQSERDATREAEFAFRQAIEADPDDALGYSNFATFLLDQSRVEEAGALLDKALALDPSFSAAYTAKGRYFLQKGDEAKALEFLLAGSAADPAAAQGLLALAIGQYQSGDLEVAAQALDNADRLDRNDPITSMVRTAIAVDQLQADAAITHAREAVRRYRNRGGYFAALASTRSGGSYLGQAYRLLGLEDWGRFYTDRVFDPFSGTGYFDQSAAYRPNIFFSRPTLDQIQGEVSDAAGSLVLQGLFFDPLAVSGRLGRIDLLRRPFLDAEVGGSVIHRDGRTGWGQEASVQAFSNVPVPTSISLTFNRERTSNPDGFGGENSYLASGFVGMQPNAENRFLFWGTLSSASPDLFALNLAQFDSDEQTVKSYQVGAGWSHTFSYQNVLTGAVVATRARDVQDRYQFSSTIDPVFGLLLTNEMIFNQRTRADTITGALGHTFGWGDFTLRTGIEAQRGRIDSFTATSITFAIPGIGLSISDDVSQEDSVYFNLGRAYTNLMWQPSDRFEMEAGVQAHLIDIRSGSRDTYVDPRIGAAFSPANGHWLRAAWRRDTETSAGFTLSPITTVGLLPHALPVSLGGRRDTTALRWDAEWTPHIFTAVEYQNQRARDLDIPFPDNLDQYALEEGRIDYITATANIWLTHGIGVFGTVGVADSSTDDGAGGDIDLPFVPKRFGRAGVTFVHPSRIRFSLIENYIGSRFDAPGGIEVDAVWTTDAMASYETPDRRFLFSLSALNLFDEQYDLVAARPGNNEAVPGTGRTFAGSLKVRF